jgi:alpha-galactosidase
MGDLGQARRPSVLNGWCDWFYAFEGITEKEVLANAEFAARHLKAFGFEYIQVDEGFQRWHGDWEGNAKFPHGMKWLADRIRELGLKPGIWLAPYVISEPTEVFKKHPEWMLREPDGKMKQVQSGYMGVRRFALDITHEGAAQWLFDLFDTVANKWGYELIKIDFVDWSLLSAERYHDASVTRAEAYRKGAEIMRKAIGDKCHLLDCGPGPVSVGLLDSMRIELDQPPVTWNQYFLKSASSAPAAAKRYYFHKRTWVNDADHVCLAPLTVAQGQAAASLIALSGGNMISGDRLPDLDPVRLEILKKVMPSYGEAARPVDLFDTDRHSMFAMKIRKPFGQWTIAGFFNISETEPLERTVPLKRLWLEENQEYLAYDFWKERFHGEVKGELRVKVAPASVTLLALHKKRGVPQVLSTDRHVLQGALELEQVTWSEATKTLEGISTGPIGTAHNLSVYIPEPHPWIQGGPFLHHDYPGFTLKMLDEHILRVRVRFEQSNRVRWEVNVAKFFERR